MNWLQRRTGPVEKGPGEADHTTIWLALFLFVIIALICAVLMGHSIAFPVG